MDGYAVRAADLAGASADAPKSLPLAGESRAGESAPPALEAGKTVRIFTGAPLPADRRIDGVDLVPHVTGETKTSRTAHSSGAAAPPAPRSSTAGS